MMNFLQMIMKRPSDKNIRIGKVFFGLVIGTTAYISFFINGIDVSNSFFGVTLNENQKDIIKYGLIILGIFPVLTGAFDLNLIQRKYTRILQIFFAIILFWYSAIIIESAKLGIETLYFLLAFIPLIGGITGKFITKKGLKTGQKVTKIRV